MNLDFYVEIFMRGLHERYKEDLSYSLLNNFRGQS